MGYKAYESSSAQMRLYMVNHLLGDSILYNETRAWSIEGKLEPDGIKNAAKQLTQRHEALRTCFVLKEGEVLQKVYDKIEIQFDYWEKQGAQPQEIEDIIAQLRTPYDPGKAPLWKIGLVQLSENRQILLMDFHHIICDGISMDVIVAELGALYKGEQLPELEVQYVDFTMWQNDLFEEEIIEKQEAYWMKIFEGEHPQLELSTDNPRPMEADIDGSDIDFQIAAPLTAELNKMAQQYKTTLYVVLLAAFNILFSKYRKYGTPEDIVIGTAVSGRTHDEFQGIVGMFVNTLAMRNKPHSHLTFKEFLTQVSQNTFAAFENQDYQFEMLVEKLAPQREMNRNPLFDIMFALQNYSRGVEISITGDEAVELKPYPLKSKTAKFDLTIQAFETRQGLSILLEYRTALFHQETIKRMATHFITILQAVVEESNVKLAEIDMMSEAEKKNILYEFNANETGRPKNKTIPQIFEEQVEAAPGAIAVVATSADDQYANTPGTGLTYRELNNRANALAREIRAKGVTAEQIVALKMNRSVEMIIAILAVLKTGGAYMPVSLDSPTKRIRYMLEDSRAAVYVTQRAYVAEIPEEVEIAIIEVEKEENCSGK
ncbi:MAG: AMP-binding protein, partial [bacterium]|nr:AMP-binding protein [bacterium]